MSIERRTEKRRPDRELWQDKGDVRLTDLQQSVIAEFKARGEVEEAEHAHWHWSRGEEAPLMVSTSVGDAVRADYDRANDDAAGRARRRFAGLRNRAMQRKLNASEAIDVSGYERRPGGAYDLGGLSEADIEGMDLCNAQTEQWIWSVGVHRETGGLYASHTGEFYQNPAFRCIWLR